jgi:hypothetical protein
MKDFKELMGGFSRYFEIVIANTPELMKKVHQLRYEVFCREFHFHYSAEQVMADKAGRPILQQLFEVVDPLIEAEARRTGLI